MGKRKRVVQTKASEAGKPCAFPWRHYLPIAFILLLTAAVYAQVRTFQFMPLDDNVYVFANGHVRGGLALQGILWALTARAAANWHPLTWISHMLDYQLYGLDPGKFHITNLLFHLASTLVLFAALKRATRSIWRSTFVAALFALHPLHVESVAWIAERKDVLSTFFWMLTMLAYVYYAEKPRIGRYAFVAVAFVLGLMAKPMLVSLPLVLLLLDYWPLKRTDLGWKRLMLEKIPLFALSIGSCLVTFIVQRSSSAVQDLNVFPIAVRIANALFASADYLAKMLLPTNIGPNYPHPGSTLPAWVVIISGLILAALTVAVIMLRRRAPYLIVGWLFYLITLAPVIGLVQVGQQGMADRYTYIPLLGIFVAIAWLVPEILQKRGHGLAIGIAGALVVLVLAGLTYHQVGAWKNRDSFVRQMLKATHNHPLSRALEANLLNQAGDHVGAERKMAELVRDYPRLPEARLGHGCTLSALRRYDEAIDEIKQAIRLKPDYAEACTNLGSVCQSAGKPEEALKWSTKAVDMAPGVGQYHANLARILAMQNRPSEAISEYELALKIQPDVPNTEHPLGVLLYNTQDTNGAIEHLQTAVNNNPDDATSQYDLGTVLRNAGRPSEAIEHLSEAVRLRPTWADAHGQLAMALDAAGQTQQAQQELQLAKQYGAKISTTPAKP